MANVTANDCHGCETNGSLSIGPHVCMYVCIVELYFCSSIDLRCCLRDRGASGYYLALATQKLSLPLFCFCILYSMQKRTCYFEWFLVNVSFQYFLLCSLSSSDTH